MRNAHKVAFGGVFAALAVVIMTLGGLIPVATYVCPMLCAIILSFVLRLCGGKVAWAWYIAVSLLSLLLSPDKEAAAVFLALGYYPIVKPMLEKCRLSWLWKFLLFNLATFLLYTVLLYVVGLDQLVAEMTELGIWGLVVTLVLGNVCFFMLDRVLTVLPGKRRGKK